DAISNPSNKADVGWGCDSSPGSTVQQLSDTGVQTTAAPCYDMTTVADSLNDKGLSWEDYAPAAGELGYSWSAFDAIAHIRNGPQWATNVVHHTQFETDAKNGNLAAVNWVVQPPSVSDHLSHSICQGENWTVNQLN